MPSRSPRQNASKPENKAFVVLISALQLMAVVTVWLLAIFPVTLMALAVTLWKWTTKPLLPAGAAKSAPHL